MDSAVEFLVSKLKLNLFVIKTLLLTLDTFEALYVYMYMPALFG